MHVERAPRIDDEGNAVLGPEDVLARLGVKELPAVVCLRRAEAVTKSEEDAEETAPSQENNAHGNGGEDDNMIVTLVSLASARLDGLDDAPAAPRSTDTLERCSTTTSVPVASTPKAVRIC